MSVRTATTPAEAPAVASIVSRRTSRRSALGIRVLTRTQLKRELRKGVVTPVLALVEDQIGKKGANKDDRTALLADAERPQDHDVP